MSIHIYYNGNHRRNLTLYWRQFYPDYEIPAGYHVHHIKPKCTFEDKHDPRIHHPSNLIALHPDDHVSIHKCRGDKLPSKLFLSIKGRTVSEETRQRLRDSHKGLSKGKKISEAQKKRHSEFMTGRKFSKEHREKLRLAKQGKPGRKQTKKTAQKIAATKIGKKAFNNGMAAKMFVPGTQPLDFIYAGHLPK